MLFFAKIVSSSSQLSLSMKKWQEQWLHSFIKISSSLVDLLVIICSLPNIYTHTHIFYLSFIYFSGTIFVLLSPNVGDKIQTRVHHEGAYASDMLVDYLRIQLECFPSWWKTWVVNGNFDFSFLTNHHLPCDVFESNS